MNKKTAIAIHPSGQKAVNIFEEVLFREEYNMVAFQIKKSKETDPNITMQFEDTYFKITITDPKCSYEAFQQLVYTEAAKYYQHKIFLSQAELDVYRQKLYFLGQKIQ